MLNAELEKDDDAERKAQRCLYVEHGWICLRDGTGWLIGSVEIAKCGTGDIFPALDPDAALAHVRGNDWNAAINAVEGVFLLHHAATQDAADFTNAILHKVRALKQPLPLPPKE